MVESINDKIVFKGEPFSFEQILLELDKEFGYRLPTLDESIFIDFDCQAIWIDKIIGKSRCVMDKDWGIQAIKDGEYGLILVEKQDKGK